VSTTGTRLDLADADRIAGAVRAQIDGESIVAGSVRRRCPTVGDVEVLVHAAATVRLDVAAGGLYPGLYSYRGAWETIRGGHVCNDPTHRQSWKQWQLRDRTGAITLDLYRFDDFNRGSMLLIRTGPAAFSKRFVTELRRRGLRHEGGYVRSSAEPVGEAIVPCPLEKDAFALAGMAWVEPEDRR